MVRKIEQRNCRSNVIVINSSSINKLFTLIIILLFKVEECIDLLEISLDSRNLQLELSNLVSNTYMYRNWVLKQSCHLACNNFVVPERKTVLTVRNSLNISFDNFVVHHNNRNVEFRPSPYSFSRHLRKL